MAHITFYCPVCKVITGQLFVDKVVNINPISGYIEKLCKEHKGNKNETSTCKSVKS